MSPSTWPFPGLLRTSWHGRSLQVTVAQLEPLNQAAASHSGVSEKQRWPQLTLHRTVDIVPVGKDDVHIVQLQSGQGPSQSCRTADSNISYQCGLLADLLANQSVRGYVSNYHACRQEVVKDQELNAATPPPCVTVSSMVAALKAE